ncbi:MAG: hypothetical protein ACRDY7_09995 [Acidimicrobiia bacterium]
MPLVAVFDFPTFTQERYEQTVQKLTGKSRMESPADWPAEGLLVHIAGQSDRGFRVVDVWESEDAFKRFAESITPILAEVGMDGQPEVYSTHTYVSA